VGWVKAILTIWRTSQGLKGMAESRTTQLSAAVLGACAFGVACLGYVLPEFADRELQQSLLLVLLAVAGVVGQRVVSYKERRIPAEAVTVILAGVRKAGDTVWRAHQGTVLDANVEGWDLGYDFDGYVWDVKKFERTGEAIRVRRCAEEQSAALVRRAAEILKGEDNTDNGMG